jgi:hypothetical protein
MKNKAEKEEQEEMGRLGREKKLNLSVWVKRHNERKTQE